MMPVPPLLPWRTQVCQDPASTGLFARRRWAACSTACLVPVVSSWRSYEVVLDSQKYATGDDWKEIGAWTLRRTGQLILIGTEGALRSEAVEREVRIFSSTGRQVLPIDFDGSLERIDSDSLLGACPRKKSLKNNVLELRRGDLKISPFPETRVLTGDQNFLIFSKNA